MHGHSLERSVVHRQRHRGGPRRADGAALLPRFRATRTSCGPTRCTRRTPILGKSGPAWRKKMTDCTITRGEKCVPGIGKVCLELEIPGSTGSGAPTAFFFATRTMNSTLTSAIALAISQASRAAQQAFEDSLEQSCERLRTRLASSLDASATSAFRPVPRVSAGAESGALLAGRLALGGSSPPPADSPPRTHRGSPAYSPPSPRYVPRGSPPYSPASPAYSPLSLPSTPLGLRCATSLTSFTV